MLASAVLLRFSHGAYRSPRLDATELDVDDGVRRSRDRLRARRPADSGDTD